MAIERQLQAISICVKAISNLEAAVQRGKDAINVYEKNIKSLQDVQSGLNFLKSCPDLTLEIEGHSKRLYKELKKALDAPIGRSSHVIDQQIDHLQSELQAIWEKFKITEHELGEWKVSLALHQSLLQKYEMCKSGIEGEIASADSRLGGKETTTKNKS